jgi:DNA-binding transcriptional LysR family regulator
VDLQLRDMSTSEQVEALVAGDIDVGFVRMPVTDARLLVRPVLDERLVLAMGRRTTWNGRVGLASVAPEPFIVIARSRSASFYDHVLRLCASAGFAPRIVQEVHELFTALTLVGAGLGVALVPRSAVSMRPPGVRFGALALEEAAWDISVAWHRDAKQVPLVARFVELVRAARVVSTRGRSPARL